MSSATSRPQPARTSADDLRREQVLDAALALLQAAGYRDTTMLQVASRAQASKNTLYRFFPTKQALFAALVARAAAQMNAELAQALAADRPPQPVLRDFAAHLLRLLTGPVSLAINRAAIAEAESAPELARTLAAQGREHTAPLFMRYLDECVERGQLRALDAAQAFDTLLGLALGDLQVRLLLGVARAPSARQIDERAGRAAAQFLALYGPPG